MEAVHKSLDVSHVWITNFVKLPKDTVGSFIMTFNTDAVADLLGIEEANAADRLQDEGGPEGVPSSQADIQPSEPSSPTSHLPSVSAGPSSGPDPTTSQVATEGSASQASRKGKRKTRDKTQTFVPLSFYLPYGGLVRRAALALKTCEPSFTAYKSPKECEPSVSAFRASPRTSKEQIWLFS